MADGLHGPNVVRAGESSLLLVRVSGGQAVHLACQHEPPKPGRGAVPDYFFDPSNRERDTIQRRYDIAALRDPVWAHTTMCGRVWAAMVGGDGGPLSRYREPAFAPTCRRCLTLMDRLFPAPAVDQRVPVVAQLVFEAVHARIRRGAGRAR